MPRNGSGVYTLPPGSTFVPNTLAQSSVVNGINNDLATDLNTPRPIVAGGTGASVKIWEDMCVYATKAGNYTAIGTDNNAIHTYTAAATVALTPAATLLANWHYTVIAYGGAVTIDPNAAETINGAATLTVPLGTSADIICDGANFFTVFKPVAWEVIGDFTLSAAANLSVTNLSAYRKVRISGKVTASTAAAIFVLNTSTNNGSTYDVGGTDYIYQVTLATSSTVSTSSSPSAAWILSAIAGQDAATGYVFEYTIEAFNKAEIAEGRGSGYGVKTGIAFTVQLGGQRSATTARNALQLSMNTGTLTGTVTVEGMRG